MTSEGKLLHDTAHSIGRIKRQVELMILPDSNHVISDKIRERLEIINEEAWNIERLLDEYYEKIHEK